MVVVRFAWFRLVLYWLLLLLILVLWFVSWLVLDLLLGVLVVTFGVCGLFACDFA